MHVRIGTCLIAHHTMLRRLASLLPARQRARDRPDSFHGVLTKWGWVLVPRTHAARGWTQPQLNEFLGNHIQAGEKLPFSDIQDIVDRWTLLVKLSDKPVARKRTKADVERDQNRRLYIEQLREDMAYSGPVSDDGSGTILKPRPKKVIPSGQVTFTHAWNYFMAKQYSQIEDMTEKEKRVVVGQMWRGMSMDEKDVYREEYSQLLALGKDIFHGKIVDREVKRRAVEKLNESKQRLLRRKQGIKNDLDTD